MVHLPAPPVAAIAARKPVAAIGDRGCVPARDHRGHLIPPAHRHKPTHAPSLRGYHMGSCLALLIVLQLKADNIQPLQATLTGPSAVLVKSTNTFTVAITGGERPYIVEWWQGVTRLAVNSNMGYASSAQYSYIAPDEPRHETLTAFVSDACSNPCPRETSANCSFWQVKITLRRDGAEITGRPDVWAGERMNVSIDIKPSAAELINAAKQWSVGGRAIAAYNVTRMLGQVIPLSSASMRNSELCFYWMQGRRNGVLYAVTNTLTVNGTRLSTDASFTVFCPEVLAPAQMGSTRLYHSGLNVYIELGDEVTPGIAISPPLHGTFYHWIQIGQVDCEWIVYKWGFPTLVKHISSGLDALVQRAVFTDRPCIYGLWWNTRYMSAAMTFKNYYTFKYNNDAIYVPLQEVSWAWTASGHEDTNGWQLGVCSRRCAAPVPFPAHLPEWSGEISRLGL